MSDERVTESFELYADQIDWLKRMVEAYDLSDASKALRCLINHAREDADPAEVFETIRCSHC